MIECMAILFVCPPFHALAVAFLPSRAFFHNLILLYEINSFCQMRIIIYAPVFTTFFHIPSLLISFVVILFRCYTPALFISFFFSHTFEAESISQRKLWSEISSHFCFRFQFFSHTQMFFFRLNFTWTKDWQKVATDCDLYFAVLAQWILKKKERRICQLG